MKIYEGEYNRLYRVVKETDKMLTLQQVEVKTKRSGDIVGSAYLYEYEVEFEVIGDAVTKPITFKKENFSTRPGEELYYTNKHGCINLLKDNKIVIERNYG